MSRMTVSLGGRAADPEAGAFIGFTTDPDSSDDDRLEPKLLLEGIILAYILLYRYTLLHRVLAHIYMQTYIYVCMLW